MKLYKYRSFENYEYIKDILVNCRLYCSNYTKLNDPFEGQFIEAIDFSGNATLLQDTKKNNVITCLNDLIDPQYEHGDYRICSLSSDLSDVRLWAHYGGGHKGVAIEIDFSDHPAELHSVTYLPHLQKYGAGIPYPKKLTDLLCHKTQHWDYEKEWRIIVRNQCDYPINDRIKKVILGIGCSKQDEETITQMVNSSVPVVKARLDHLNVKVII